MTGRAEQLNEAADRQIAELVRVLSGANDADLAAPCPGRERLGDGTVGAVAEHIADNYLRIAAFVHASGPIADSNHQAGGQPHRIPPFRHGPGAHGPSGDVQRAPAPEAVEHADLESLLNRLARARQDLRRLADLTDAQLDAVPPASEMRFVDGKRTLEQILAGMLKHQAHQVETLARVLAGPAESPTRRKVADTNPREP